MKRACAYCVVSVAAAVTLLGQSAELSGLVSDPSGAAIAKARVELRHHDTGIRFAITTNQDGHYGFLALRPGAYETTVQADGFRTLTRDGIVLSVGDRASLDFSLQLGGLVSNVTVSSDTSATVTGLDGATGIVVDQPFVANMPLNGRSFQSLIHLTPGVVIMRSYQDAPGQFSVNGQRTNSNYFTVDGVSANFGTTSAIGLGQTISGSTPGLNVLGGTNGLVSVDAMQEFRIQTSTYAPEYGRSSGAQISIVTKSGGNQFHGTAYDYLRNDIFDARNWFNTVPQPKPPLRQNNFGGTLGGPIRKQRTFFFASYEGLRLRQPQTAQGNFLTAAARRKAPPVYRALVNDYPLPTTPVNPDGITAPLTVSYSDPSRFDATSLRIDHIAASWLTLFARYNHAPSMQSESSFASTERDITNTETVTTGATIIFSPGVVNDLRANWSGSTGKAELEMQSVFGAVAPPDSALFPYFSGSATGLVGFSMPFTSGAVEAGTRSNNVQRQLNLVDTISLSAGEHQMRFGFDFRRIEPTNSAVNYSLVTSPNDYQTMLAGGTNRISIYSSNPITVRLNNYSFFAQDSWTTTNRLTLTYGLRWDINTPPASVTPGSPLYAVAGIFDSSPLRLVASRLWQTPLGNVAPRVAAAWRPTQETVMRGGFGFSYDLGYGAGTPLSRDFPYYRSRTTVNNPAIPFDLNGPAVQPLPFTTEIVPGRYLEAVDPHLHVPVTYEWNVSVEHRFGTNQSVTATYAGARGKNLLRQDRVVPRGSILAAQGGSAGVTYNAGYSHYNALQTAFLRRMSHGLQALVTYTLAKSIDTSSTDVGLGSSAHYTQMLAGSVKELPMPALAPSDLDARHTFSAAVSWKLPPANVAHGLLRNWALDGIVRVNSALPLNVLYQQLFAGGYYNVQPDVVPGQPYWVPDANQPRGRALNPKAFAQPTGANGNFPRNSLRGFTFNQADIALRRRFALSEGVKLDARVEYFNALNHPMFGSPYKLWGYGSIGPLPAFGKVTPGDTLNYDLGGGGLLGGQAPIYAPGGPRSAQFMLKLVF